MDKYERLQALLRGVKDHYCDGNAAELARQIGRSASYVNRLFYERHKNGAKGIGPDIMEACSAKFDLPRGFWEMDPAEAFVVGHAMSSSAVVSAAAGPREILDAVELLRNALRLSNRPTRISLVPLLTALVQEPDNSGDIAQHIAFLLGRSAAAQKSPEDPPLKKVGRDIRVSLDEEANGTSDSTGQEEERRPGVGGVSGGDAR